MSITIDTCPCCLCVIEPENLGRAGGHPGGGDYDYCDLHTSGVCGICHVRLEITVTQYVGDSAQFVAIDRHVPSVPVERMAWSSDGRYLAISGRDGVRVFAWWDGRAESVDTSGLNPAGTLAGWVGDDAAILVAGRKPLERNGLRIWSPSRGALSEVPDGIMPYRPMAAWAYLGEQDKWVVFHQQKPGSGSAEFVIVEGSREIRRFRVDEAGGIRRLLRVGDGPFVLVGRYPFLVSGWELTDKGAVLLGGIRTGEGTPIRGIEPFDALILPDGKLLIVAGPRPSVVTVDLATWSIIETREAPRGMASRVNAFAGVHLIAGTGELVWATDRLDVLEASTLEHVETLPVASDLDRWLVAPHPSGEVIAYGAGGQVRLLERSSKRDWLLSG